MSLASSIGMILLDSEIRGLNGRQFTCPVKAWARTRRRIQDASPRNPRTILDRYQPDFRIGTERFWFDWDFKRFALQIRGGLDVENIVGIYADEQAAKNTAMELLAAGNDSVIHQSPWPDWFATQESRRSVSICDKASDERIEVQPPASWGKKWAWNISEDGTGVTMRKTP